MVTLKGWRRSNAGTPRDYNASIVPTGMDNDYPYACSFTSADKSTIAYQLPADSGFTPDENSQLIAVGDHDVMWLTLSGTTLSIMGIHDGILCTGDPREVTTEHENSIEPRIIACKKWGYNNGEFGFMVVYASTNGDNFLSAKYYEGGASYPLVKRTGAVFTPIPDFSSCILGRLMQGEIDEHDSGCVRLLYKVDDGGGADYHSCQIYQALWAELSITNTDMAAGDDYMDIWRVTDAYWVRNNGTPILQYSVDFGVNWLDLDDPDATTDYLIVASDGTYIYATKSSSLWKGTLDIAGNPDSVTWTEVLYYGGYTLIGVDANSTNLLIVVQDTTYEYMLGLDTITSTISSFAITRKINTVPSVAQMVIESAESLANIGILYAYDSAGVERFRGYALPSADDRHVDLESVDRELKTRMTNNAFTTETAHDAAATLLTDCDIIAMNTNNLNDVAKYDQAWGSAMPAWAALSTIAMWSTGYFRSKVNQIDCYLIAFPNDSTKTLTWGTTSAQLLGDRPAITKPINRLVVYGAFSSTGLLQYTLEDENDQTINGIQNLYVRRHDLQTYAAVVAYADELWLRRKSVQTMPRIYTVRVFGFVWLDAGDKMAIVGASKVSLTMTDGEYIILSNQQDLVQGWKILELSTSIVSTQTDFNDLIPIAAQTPIEGTDSASGDAITQTSFSSLLGAKWNDLITTLTSGKIPASNYPDWAAFTTNTYAYKFAIDEYIDLTPTELVHGWIEGGTIKPHVHIVLSAATAQEEKVQFTLYYSWGDVNEVMSAEATVSGEYTVPNATADRTHLLITLTDIAGTDLKIGSIMNCRLKRVAKSAGGNELTAEPFVLSFGIHIEMDALGSKEVVVK